MLREHQKNATCSDAFGAWTRLSLHERLAVQIDGVDLERTSRVADSPTTPFRTRWIGTCAYALPRQEAERGAEGDVAREAREEASIGLHEPIIADANTGHGGSTANGIVGTHEEGQKLGTK